MATQHDIDNDGSSVDTLIDLIVRCQLRCPIPVRRDRNTLTDLYITTVLTQR